MKKSLEFFKKCITKIGGTLINYYSPEGFIYTMIVENIKIDKLKNFGQKDLIVKIIHLSGKSSLITIQAK